jgi:hypothetical protein
MNKMVFVAAVAALGLAACGGGGKQALVNSCVKEGTDKKVCTCTIDEAEKNMDKKAFAALTKAAAKGEGAMDNAMGDLPMDQQMAAGMALVGAAMKCGMANQ